MNVLLQLLLSLGAAFAFAVVARPLLTLRGRWRTIVSTIVSSSVLVFPLLIAADHVRWRALSAFLCTELMFKMVDYARHCRLGTLPCSPGDYLRFLIPFPSLVVVLEDRGHRLGEPLDWRRETWRMVVGWAVFASGFGMLHLLNRVAILQENFVLDHGVKFIVFVMAIEALGHGIYGVERLAGYETRPPMRSIYLSSSVSEFWRRYNTRVHRWLELNVFVPCGGRRAPIVGIFWVFFVSAIHHDVMFAVATSHVDGYQFAFFMLQAPAVVLSGKIARWAGRRNPWGATLIRLVTLIWFYFTSMLFFHGMNRVFSFFYAGEPWLP